MPMKKTPTAISAAIVRVCMERCGRFHLPHIQVAIAKTGMLKNRFN